MAQELWSLKEDGYLNVDLDSQNIVYHPTLNIILVTTRSGYVHVLDVNSGVVLHTSSLSAKANANIKCSYLEEENKVLFLDGQGVGVRSDYNGVLLLDTILQRRLKSSDDVVKLELLLSEAIIFQQSLKNVDLASADLNSEVQNELTDKITRAQSQPRSGIKAQKWNTICLELKLSTLRSVALRVVNELNAQNCHVPALAVAAAISERLTELAPREVIPSCDRAYMYSEAKRRETFARWPHMDYKWALPEQMAQAGFYHQPNNSGDDRAMCFTCSVCLVCWERTDEPWSEHERHSPTCPFVKGEYTQNVPLAVSYATSPALDIAPRGYGGSTLVSNSNVTGLIALGNSGGMVSVYNTSGKLKRTHCFYVTHADYGIPNLVHNVLKRDNNVTLTALSIVGEKKRTLTPQSIKSPTKSNKSTTKQKSTQIRPSIICGISVSGNITAMPLYKTGEAVEEAENSSVEALNNQNQQKSELTNSNMFQEFEEISVKKYSYLVVYDFQYKSAACSTVTDQEQDSTSTTKDSTNVLNKESSGLLTKLCNMDSEEQSGSQENSFNDEFDSAAVGFWFSEPTESYANNNEMSPKSYQNFIPHNIEKILFPPDTVSPEAHNGPRVYTEDVCYGSYLQNDKKVDYSLTNGQLLEESERLNEPNEPGTSSEKSISDHINDIKAKGERTISYSHTVQCVMLPENCQNKNLEIFEIIPTKNGKHILVVLRSKDMNILGKSMLLIYALNFSSRVVKIEEKPLLSKELTASEQPEEISLLPILEENDGQGTLEGLATMVCADGAVRLIDLATLNIVSEAKSEGTRYVSASYCNSLERLCVCTERGPLHFYAILGQDNDFSEEKEEEDINNMEINLSSPIMQNSLDCTGVFGSENVSQLNPDLTKSYHTEKVNDETLLIEASKIGDTITFSEMLNCRASLTVPELRLLHSFSQCEPLSSSYCAILPACWSEMQQCQRKLPQQIQATSDGGTQHTRTWRLQTDATTWDEHVFELTLPWNACVGHVDLRFTLHAPCLSLPNLQVTLLKQHASGIGYRKYGPHTTPVDDAVNFSLFENTQANSSGGSGNSSSGSIQNPVLTDEYLRAHNADILCGPVNLATCLDLSEHSGCVTLTSPKLLKARGRTLLIHIKALLDPSKDITNTKRDDKLEGSFQKVVRKAEYYMGCDWLREISITIRAMKQVNLPNERSQRSAVVESNHLINILCESACRESKNRSRLIQMLALDLLTWIANVRLGRRGSDLGVQFLRTLEPHLYALTLAGLIEGSRSVAHKFMKLMIVCVESGRTMMNIKISQQFDNAVLQAILKIFPMLGRINSASALRWLTMLLKHVAVSGYSGAAGAAVECISLVRRLAQQLQTRTNPYHQLLRSRFGLYGIPFEPELLDIDPPTLQKSSSAPVIFGSVASGETFPSCNISIHPIISGSGQFDLKELFLLPGISVQKNRDNKTNGISRCRALVTNNYTRGLLETESLHYTCVSASDGTRMERLDANSGITINPTAINAPSTNNTATWPLKFDHGVHSVVGGSSSALDDYIQFCKSTFNDLLMEEKNSLNILKNSPNKVGSWKAVKPEETTEKQDQFFQVDKNFKEQMSVENSSVVEKNDSNFNNFNLEMDSDIADSFDPQFLNNSSWTQENKENVSSNDASDNNKASTNKGPRKDTEKLDSKKTENDMLPWQQLLLAPPQQVLVIERMYSGARRFVILDFGTPVLLTDLFIPACTDLVSLSIHVWWQGEDIDGIQLVVASDISTKCLVLSDLQPPPLCRYLKITTIGIHGMSTTRCKIPVGNFYGHVVILPEDTYANNSDSLIPTKTQTENHLNILTAILEDINCRYSLACTKLKDHLDPLLANCVLNNHHMNNHLKYLKEEKINSAENLKIYSIYQECITYQQQLNVVRNVMKRLESHIDREETTVFENENRCLAQTSTDKLVTICECFLDVLIAMVYEIGALPRVSSSLFKHFNQTTCEELFMTLCVNYDTRLQLSAASLLVRMCGLQPWWGQFLSDTITKLYASHNQSIFPQERVFIVLGYLCRKSLSNGASKSTLLDPTLKSLCGLLKPLISSENLLVAAKTDLGLLSWLLLFLSISLDSTKNESDNSEDAMNTRWDWLIAETTAQRTSTINARNTDNYRKKVYKKILHYKSQISHLEHTHKSVQQSAQAFCTLSNQAATLSSKIEAALKQEHRKNKQGPSKPLVEDVKVKRYDHFNQSHYLAVCRGLVLVILNMDCTCNIDIFLLACKTLARLIMSTKPPLSLHQLVTSEQLVQLLRLAVHNEGTQWISHAITCLLLDMLEGQLIMNRNALKEEFSSSIDSNNEMETDSQQFVEQLWLTDSENIEPNDIIDIDDVLPMVIDQEQEAESQLTNISNPSTSKSNGVPLPSLPEFDDSEVDEVLVYVLEKEKNLLRKNGTEKSSLLPTSSISTAIDARLEVGFDSMPEIMLRRLSMVGAYNLPIAINGSLTAPPAESIRSPHVETWPDDLILPWMTVQNGEVGNVTILTQSFDVLFSDLERMVSVSILEQTLQLWITISINLTENNTYYSSVVPGLTISTNAISHLMSALTWLPSISLRAWTLAFQCLTLASNLPYPDWNGNDIEQSLNGMAGYIIKDPLFSQMMFRFLSGNGLLLAEKNIAGPSVCQILYDFLVRLQMRSDVVTITSSLGNYFKDLMLKLVHQLIEPSLGPIAQQKGPLDVQYKFINSLLNLDFKNIDFNITLNIMDSLGCIVYNYMTRVESVKCVTMAEQSNQGNSFNSLFSSVLGTDANAQGKPASYDSLIISLLHLGNKLIQIPLPSPQRDSFPSTTATRISNDTENDMPMSSENQNISQTDESKAEQRSRASSLASNSTSNTKILYVADKILHRIPTILRFCYTLSISGRSSLVMIAGALPHCLSEIREPANVGDAVFQLLTSISTKSSSTELLLTPILELLSPEGVTLSRSGTQLSEPLVWWLLQILSTEEAMNEFSSRGGVRFLAEHLVRCYRRVIATLQPATISHVMQYLSSPHGVQLSSTAYQGGAPNSKKMIQASIEQKESLINFAPLGTISTSRSSSQSADVLIQATLAPHRRARTPQWSYHFCPDENHVELLISLPAAILLREVQLHPHSNNLATCPSAVALEISRNGSSALIPLCPPLQSSGMSSIRMHLPTPEVATNVLLRLYKPRESSTIGLLQIRLLGTPAFGGQNKTPLNDLCEEEQLTKSSLGWLRLLHHCIRLPSDNSELALSIIHEAAKVPYLIEACCGLLLVPVQIPLIFIPNLERVLLKLSLYDLNISFRVIKMLLNNSAAFLQTTKITLRTSAVESVCELLHKLCRTENQDTIHRISTVLVWLHEIAEKNISCPTEIPPNASYIHCIASILWDVRHSESSVNLKQLITKQLFEVIYTWSTVVGDNLALKKSINALLCSFCVISEEFFPLLLFKMSVLVPNLSTDRGASVSDDQKDSNSMTDDSKQCLDGVFEAGANWHTYLKVRDLSTLTLSGSQLQTIAIASRSPLASRQLLDSGLLKVLVQAVSQFCDACSEIFQGKSMADMKLDNAIELVFKDSPIVRTENIVNILLFFAELCVEVNMREWFGSPMGSVFWLPLLRLLCHDKCSVKRSQLQSENYYKLEDATVKFLSRCCSLCSLNQTLLTVCLCDIVENKNMNIGMCGFTRRLILQLLLENEKVWVLINTDETVIRQQHFTVSFDNSLHPAFRVTNHHMLLQLNINMSLQDILDNYVSFMSGSSFISDIAKNATHFSSQVKGLKKDLWEVALDMTDKMSVAAGVTAKDKRVKDAKNLLWKSSTPTSDFKRKVLRMENVQIPTGDGSSSDKNVRYLKCEDLPYEILPNSIKLSQILSRVHSQILRFTLVQNKENLHPQTEAVLSEFGNVSTTLEVFSSFGGLAILSQHLPLAYTEAVRLNNTPMPSTSSASAAEATDTEWVKVEESEYIYEDLEDTVPGGSHTPTHPANVALNIPPHSLAAFALFLRLPGYADVLLKDYKKAQCLLRLVLGVTDDGEGVDIFSLPIAPTLPMLPFQVLRQLYDTTPITTDDSQLLRKTSIEYGVIHLILGCFAVFTHQTQDFRLPGSVKNNITTPTTTTTTKTNGSTAATPKTEDKSHLYWAKGTGFGTGSIQQSWNVEQALMRQRSEEEHVTVLLQVLSSYINPGGTIHEFSMDIDYSEDMFDSNEEQLPSVFYDLLLQSCLLPALCSYLRNDSVLDMARHIPLYQALLQLIRSIAMRSQLVTLLLPQTSTETIGGASNNGSVVSLLANMKVCVDTYASKLKLNKRPTSSGTLNALKGLKLNKYMKASSGLTSSAFLEDNESDEGLAILIPDIKNTADLVKVAASHFGAHADEMMDVITEENLQDHKLTTLERPLKQALEERYMEVMKQLQFDTFEMIRECSESEGGGYQFVVSYHFESNVKTAGDRSHSARVKRLAQEAVTLATSLPLSYSSSVFVRCDADRLDVMKVLITGPADTPYANGCFELDVYFPPDYPQAPMMINLETTGRHSVRFNPNLYNDGKVCLSVLNTWHGRPEEKWNSQTSSFLQVLVSIQSLILVPEPYFNEPGYERSRGSPSGTQSSLEYNANICQATVRWAMLEQIRNPCPCFKQVIHTHFWLKRHEIVEQVERWISEIEAQSLEKRSTSRSSSKRVPAVSALALKHHYLQLYEELLRLKTPEGLEDLEELSKMDNLKWPNTSGASKSSAAVPKGAVTNTSFTSSSPGIGLISTATQSTNTDGIGNMTDTPINVNEAFPSFVFPPLNEIKNEENNSTSIEVNHDIDTDMEMEKMVSEVCE